MKCGKIPFRVVLVNSVELSMYEGHMEAVELIWPNIGAFVIGFCRKTAEMLSICI